MKSISLLLFVLLIYSPIQGQITFKKIIASDNDEKAYSIIQTSDGGFAVCGEINIGNESFCYLIKTDEFGDTLWTKKYPGGPEPYESIFKQTPDDGFIICSSLPGLPGTGINLIRTDPAGDTVWTKIFPQAWGNAIEISPDGGFVIAGGMHTNSMVIKTDSSGNEVWRREFHPIGTIGGYSRATAVCNTTDNGYMVAGNADHNPTYFTTYYIFSIKLDHNGDSVWGKIYDDVFYQKAFSVHQTPDNGYILGGYMDSIGSGGRGYEYAIKTTGQGEKTWSYLKPSVSLGYFCSLHVVPAGGYVACGGSITGNHNDILLEKISSNGTLEWKRYFTDWHSSVANSVRPTADNGFVLCGGIIAGTSPAHDIVIIKTDSSGTLTGLNDDIHIHENALRIFPNPCSSFTNLTYERPCKETIRIEFLNHSGAMVKEFLTDDPFIGRHRPLVVDLNTLPGGIYYVRLTADERIEVQKLIVIK